MEVTIDLDEMFRCGDVCPACSYVYTCDNMGFYEECPLFKLANKDKEEKDV